VLGDPLPLHPQAVRLLELFRDSRTGARRSGLEVVREIVGEGPVMAEVRDVRLPGPGGELGGRIYRPEGPIVGTIVYFHPGGWVSGALDDFDVPCRLLALESGCQVLSVDYRLAPQHPFPAAADDAFESLCWASEHLAGGDPLVVAGDSAGGNLAAVSALRARDAGGPRIALQVLVYPILDHDFETASYREHATAYLLGRENMISFWDRYVPEQEARDRPDASPLRAPDLTDLPPAYIAIAEYDVLRDEARRYAERLATADVRVSVAYYGDMPHGFFTMVNALDRANEAAGAVGRAVATALEEGR
jgi:acetyl esterase